MYPVTPDFLATLREPSIRAVVRISASNGSTLLATSGRVEMDSRRSITRTCDLELVPTDDYDVDALYALVMTPSVEITVSRGVMVGNAAQYVPLGVFSTDTARKNDETVSWSGSDRSKKIARARFTDTYQIVKDTPLADAGTALLQSRWSFTPVNFAGVTEIIGATLNFDAGPDSDPWQEARALFAEYGYELAFDGTGTARATPVPDPSTVEAAFDLGSGETNLVLEGETSGTFEGTYNGVIATGEGSDIETPVRAVVWDDDPTSPTYYQGGFGLVPRFYSSPLLTTEAQCATAAATILAKSKGRQQQMSVTSVVNPALEPLDVVTASVYGTPVRFVIDKVTVPLRAAEAMAIEARETSVR